jgi:acetyl-CoA C-acetyltransferase
VAPQDARHLELYSCFPSAVQIQAAELGIGPERALTVTGGMTFAGGPLNSAGLHGVATMVDALRDDPGSFGLVSAISGMITKGGLSLWSTQPPDRPFELVDVTDAVLDETAAVAVDAGFAGTVEVEATTVAFDREGPSLTVIAGRTPNGDRVVATSGDRDLAATSVDSPPTGGALRVDGPRIA